MSSLAPCRHQLSALLLSVIVLIHSLPRMSSSQLQNADYSGKVNVKVSEILTNRPNAADRSWPPENSNEFAKVNIDILGTRIDGTTFHNLRPDAAHSNPRKLRKILGSHFEREWMSIEEPKHAGQKDLIPVSTPDPALLRQVERLNFTFVDTAGARVQIQPQYLRVWKSWLIQQATCPINYFWEDLGTLFWPRWVRRGHCVPTHQCSWPSGMSCRPSHSRSVRLLQWKCDQDNDVMKRKRAAADRRERRQRRKQRRRWQRGKRNNRNWHWESRQKRRQRRIRRLIRKMSMSVNGYFCQWVVQQYVVNDRCSCMCHEG